ncbi:hypothetical protein J1N35_000106 [Gossypium stocksii]|uniref:Vesicle tethering protein Uso1/P115-like head domain-containing protein n=1 Tax=Gossypium stocksii TaxID=47602 RepID=A0A9D3WI61_9ROSI|nr:hypothetical protein J1N35_000106 [Gossypium stocksii]
MMGGSEADPQKDLNKITNKTVLVQVLRIELEAPTPSFGAPELLLHRMVRYLAVASSVKDKDGKPGYSYVQPILLKLLVTWLADCPSAVQCFLDSRPHLTYLLELVSNTSSTVCVMGLAAFILGECVIDNKSSETGKDAITVADAISQKIGLTSYFLTFDEMQRSSLFSSAKSAESHKPLTRSAAANLQEASQRVEMHKAEKAEFELEASTYQNLAGKLESDLKSLSDAYNSLEQSNHHLEKQVEALESGRTSTSPDIDAVKTKAREEAQKESEAELNDLLMCLGQEQSKVEN